METILVIVKITAIAALIYVIWFLLSIKRKLKEVIEELDDRKREKERFEEEWSKVKFTDLILADNRDRKWILNVKADTVAVITTGIKSSAINQNPRSVAISTGSKSCSSSGGAHSLSVTRGDDSQAICNGSWSVAICTGCNSDAIANGRESIAIATGCNSKAKGLLGCWIVLADRNGVRLRDVKAFYIDGEKIKENTYYELKNGEAVISENQKEF